jgi:hypothetical protein
LQYAIDEKRTLDVSKLGTPQSRGGKGGPGAVARAKTAIGGEAFSVSRLPGESEDFLFSQGIDPSKILSSETFQPPVFRNLLHFEIRKHTTKLDNGPADSD